MGDLTDFELCKCIAEIEGHEIPNPDEWYVEDEFFIIENECSERYNPITDDALCFRLMVKYEVVVNYAMMEVHIIDDNAIEYDNGCAALISFNSPDEIPRAILTAIVESNNE